MDTSPRGFAERLGHAIRCGMRAVVRWPRWLDPLKAVCLAFGVLLLKRGFMRGFQPPLQADYGFGLAGRPTESMLNGIVFFRGVFEPVLSEVIDRTVCEGDVCVDAGANAGYFTLLFARKVGAAGRVVAIEPVPGNVKRIERNVAHNGFESRVRIAAAACSDVPGQATFHVNTRNDMHCRLHLPRKTEADYWLMGGRGSWREITVATNTLAGILGAQAPEVSFVKLDIEGAEHLVVRDLIAHCVHPRLMVALEAKAPHIRETLEPFEKAGFHIYDLRNDYRWLLNTQVASPLACSYESLYERKYMADVLVTREKLEVEGGPEKARPAAVA
ncbi:MAG: FkbM family methyltransferase [Ramlibacter sp.]